MKQIIYIDASCLKDTGCWRKWYWNTVKGLAPNAYAEHSEYKMAYGTAFHLFLEDYYNNVSVKEAAIKAVDYYRPYNDNLPTDKYGNLDYRTTNHLLKSINKYIKTYTLGECGLKPLAVEQKFGIPYWHNSDYEIMLCGTIDMIAEYYGQLCIVDHKTTSIHTQDSFISEYDLAIQTMFYSWIDNKYNNRRPNEFLPVLINGIFIKAPTETATKKGMFDGVKFKRSGLITYTVEQMFEFEQWLNNKLTVIKTSLCFIEEPFTKEPDFSFCKTPFGICKYFQVCKSPPDIRDRVKEYHYSTKEYNPLKFKD